MDLKKKILVIVGVLFTLAMAAFAYDFMRRTSPPGSRKHLVESIAPTAADSTLADTLDLETSL